jgi:hypothetical protein
MPTNWAGQMITFAAEIDPDSSTNKLVLVKALKGDTIRKVAARRGHPELAASIVTLNKGRDLLPHPKRQPGHKAPPIPKLRSATQVLRTGAVVRLPGILKAGEFLSVNAGDEPPVVKAGYAKYDVVDVPGRIGISRFLGYDPIAIDIPVQFENYAAGLGGTIETNIQILERMAGRGDYPGAAVGPPAVIRISARDAHGNAVPLIPPDYQWSSQHQHAPLFRISTIVWDAGAQRNDTGYRVRQTATVTVTQYTPLQTVIRSVARRTQTIPSKTSKR